MGKILICAAAAIIAINALVGCSTTGCTDNQNSLPLAGFYTTGADGEPMEISIDSLEIGGVGAPGDSLLYTASDNLSQVYLPLRSTSPTTSFCIHYAQKALSDPALNDTLTFDYSASPYFASEECGALYYYRISRLKHTTHLIDSIVITDSLITNADLERIRIYFRTSHDETPQQ